MIAIYIPRHKCESAQGSRAVMVQAFFEEVHLGETRLTLLNGEAIAGKISEINLTSPGLLRQTNQVMGRKLEVELEDFFEAEFRRRTL